MPERPSYEEAERSLTEEKKISDGLINALQDGFSELDDQGRHLRINPSFTKITGFSEEDLIGIGPPHPYWPPEDHKTIEQAFKKTLEGEFDEFELSFMHKNGKRFPVIVSPSWLKDEQNKVIRYFATIKDISQRKQIENELIASEKRYRTITETMPGMAYRCNADWTITLASEGIETLTGYPASDFINSCVRSFESIMNKGDIQSVKQTVCDAIQKKEPLYATEYRITHKNGSTRWLHDSIRINYKNDGEADFYEGIALDITKRKQAEEALLESETKYRNMMESFTDPLYICSPEFTVNYMNPAMIRRIGRDAIGEKCYFALHGLDSKCDWCIFDKFMSGETIETNIKSPLDGKDFLVTNMPLQNQDGTISKMTIFRDITDYLQAVSEKEELQAQLTQSQKMESIGNLAGGIAHDFNNILSSMIGFTELALDDAIRGSVQEDNLQEVYTAGKRAKDLVKQILLFARQSEKEKKPVQVDLVVKEAMKLIKSTTPATIKIRQNIDSQSLILANPTQIHQVVMNLCTNAVDAMNDGGILSIKLRDEQLGESFTTGYSDLNPGEYIALTVSDTGCGIPAELVESIYEPYFTTKKFGEGTGLGLSTVYGIVKQCNGEIFIETEPNRGSKFKVYMPITKKREKLTAYRHGTLAPGKEKILFVDDEISITKMIQQTLSRLGYNVIIRTSPIEALEFFKVRSNDIDLVITDMTMPNITGDKLSIELMKIRPDIPIILCSGFSKKISDEIASKIGIRALVYKPIVKEDLAKMIRRVLDEAKSLS